MSLFATVSMDLLQEEIHCCGVTGPYDYYQSYWENATIYKHTDVPLSCCVNVKVINSINFAAILLGHNPVFGKNILTYCIKTYLKKIHLMRNIIIIIN